MPSSYFKDIADGVRTTVKGMSLTMRHLWAARKRRMPGDVRSGSFFEQGDGMVTIQYPYETIPIPDNGRYRLHNEMDDCIVCDKCAKICPVDCIEIEPIRAVEEVGKASDGSPIRLYAAKFDIDMAKCCYCGLCTTVCPTECLTMTKTFDYSELDIRDMVYEYGNLTPAEAEEKKRLLEQFQKEKEALKAAAKATPPTQSEAKPATPRPAFRPGMKPKTAEPTAPEAKNEETEPVEKPKPAFRPGMKPKTAEPAAPEAKNEEAEPVEKPKPAFRPGMKPKAAPPTEAKAEDTPASEQPKPAFKPRMKPKAASPAEPEAKQEEIAEQPKPAFKPSMKPKATPPAEPEAKQEETAPAEKPKPAFRPSMKPKATPPAAPEAKQEEAAPAEKPKPAFKPSMKPKPPKPNS